MEPFEAFCAEHLGHLDEVLWEFFGTDIARDAVRAKVEALFPEHEHEEFTEHFWGLIQRWRDHGLDPAAVTALLGDARFKQSIVDAMTRPAEGKDWYEYRPIFLTDKRIDGGVEFWRENADLIRQAAERFEVDPEVIVAIIDVATFYGRITGGYRVLDALTTLSFYYPSELRDRS